MSFIRKMKKVLSNKKYRENPDRRIYRRKGWLL